MAMLLPLNVPDTRHIQGCVDLMTILEAVARDPVWRSTENRSPNFRSSASQPRHSCFSLRNVLNSWFIVPHPSQTQAGLLPSVFLSCIFHSKLRMRTEQETTFSCTSLSLERTLHVCHNLLCSVQVLLQFRWVFGAVTFILICSLQRHVNCLSRCNIWISQHSVLHK
jgi:hypothetical protein